MHIDPWTVTDKDDLIGRLRNRRRGDAVLDEESMRRALLGRVRGQDPIVEDLTRLIRQQKAKVTRGRPIANILFLGPTGTGKTELAKAMAEFLFGDAQHMLRFDCSEFSGAEGKSRLIGVPTGYVGADQGGQLTRPVLNNPRRLVLFDEIEKAYSGIFDLFLSMFGEGRLTEQGSGRVADFTQSIVVLTSNAEHEAINRLREQIADPLEQVDAIKKHLRDAKVFRSEILGRVDRIYVFQPLSEEVLAEIAALKTIALARQFELELEYVDPSLLYDVLLASFKVADFGARELERIVDSLFAESMIAARQAGSKRIRIISSACGLPHVVSAEGVPDGDDSTSSTGLSGASLARRLA